MHKYVMPALLTVFLLIVCAQVAPAQPCTVTGNWTAPAPPGSESNLVEAPDGTIVGNFVLNSEVLAAITGSRSGSSITLTLTGIGSPETFTETACGVLERANGTQSVRTRVTYCGDNVVDPEEECDPGSLGNDSALCNGGCLWRNGPPTIISGTVTLYSAGGQPAIGAQVEICSVDACVTRTTDGSGNYAAIGLAPGSYDIRVFPPSLVFSQPGSVGPVTAVASQTTDVDVVLEAAVPPGGDETITTRDVTPDGIPVIPASSDLTLTKLGCAGGTASYHVSAGTVTRSGSMTEGPAGFYSAVIDALHVGGSGTAHFSITVTCSGEANQSDFDALYIDPSGTVRTVAGDPVVGATVTLLRSDTVDGTFVAVPDGSAIMSPANRSNPDITPGDGSFGWDVLAGFYKVRAESPGCRSVTDPAQAFVETGVLPVPPPVTDLDLRLDCTVPPPPPTDLLPGRAMEVKNGLLKFVAKPAAGDAFVLPLTNPVAAGGSLRIFDVGTAAGDDTYALPAGGPPPLGWRGLGNPAGAKGYQYKGAGTSTDPCKIVVIKEKVIKAVCMGSGVTLAPPFAGDVGIVLSVGTTDHYCAQFGGDETKNDPTQTKRKNAPAPGTCP